MNMDKRHANPLTSDFAQINITAYKITKQNYGVLGEKISEIISEYEVGNIHKYTHTQRKKIVKIPIFFYKDITQEKCEIS